ncbi:GFA family protein [Sporobolomyces salmoneus]|uniref:GFA family protein n=1 Tax=Sporobolomyces salmoneus TaxID=183962 RepID=UPI0031700C68
MPRGSCNCGNVTIDVADSAMPKESVLCHCKNCRASSGSLFTVNYVIKTDEIKFNDESKVNVYEDKNTDSGHTAIRKFCKNCGSAILTGVKEAPEQSYVKGGLFKVGTVPAPSMEIYKRNFESWEKGHDGAQLID